MGHGSIKKPINYSHRMKTIRRFVNFDYDLRKPLSGGQKSAVTKAFREIHSYRERRYIPLPKHRGESATAYKARRKEIKTFSGQDDHRGRLIKGIFLDIPVEQDGLKREVRVVKKTKRIRRRKKETVRHFKARKKRGTTNTIEITAKAFKEYFVSADTLLLANDPRAEGERIWEEMGTKYHEVAINYSGRGRSKGWDKRGDDGTIFEKFITDKFGLNYQVDKYLKQLQYAVSGYILRIYFA